MNKQLCKELATGCGIGVGIAVSKTAIMAGTLLVIGSALPNDAYVEKPKLKQRLSLGIVGSALIGAGVLGVKTSVDMLYNSSKLELVETNEDLPNTK